jgi:hypothetical protein
MNNNIIPNTIPPRLRDINLTGTKNNATLFFILCVIIRIILSIYIFQNIINPIIIYILFGIFITIFSFKFLFYKKSWKNYPRSIISYLLVILFTFLNKKSSTINIGGLILLFDTLMGMQSRFIATNFES